MIPLGSGDDTELQNYSRLTCKEKVKSNSKSHQKTEGSGALPFVINTFPVMNTHTLKKYEFWLQVSLG